MKTPTPTVIPPAAAAKSEATGAGLKAGLQASTAAPAPGLPGSDPLRDPATPAATVAPTLDPAAPDPVPARELPGEVINAGLAGAVRSGLSGQATNLEIGAQAPGRDAVSGSTDGVVGRGTLIDTDRTLSEAALSVSFRAGEKAEIEALIDATFDGPAILVSCAHNRRRAGISFGPTPVRVPLASLDEKRIRAIDNDPLLTVRSA